jgi:hypothetical protein
VTARRDLAANLPSWTARFETDHDSRRRITSHADRPANRCPVLYAASCRGTGIAVAAGFFMATTSKGRPERRQSPRISVVGVLNGKSATVVGPLTLRDISPGGFAVESRDEFTSDRPHQFELSSSWGRRVVVEARVVHCVRMKTPAGQFRYRTGFAFVETAALPKSIATLIAELMVLQ